MTMAGEPCPILDHQAAQYGFTVQHLAVPPPGLDQKAIWLRVKVAQPDWVILRQSPAISPGRPCRKRRRSVSRATDRWGRLRLVRSRRCYRLGRRPGFICATW